ncbi:PREDICTED: vacuolar protein sorting-associated protein 16 homolog [Ceratosolen solmsi marchali]|nr:PREDICTED: vacuolar protein sorting-associated protein 16 homolog [Ceratosolen solmsi marchali]XP_011503943.1 PREDICTED: vacuolar protein sorting-associated protein 16 homolog [Ceratosolen solmsi marchali]
MAIMHCPLAMTLYIKYCQNHNRETLRDIYNQYDDYYSQALWFIKESYQNSTSRDAMLQSALDHFKLSKHDANSCLIDEQIKLLRYQRSLEETLHESVVGKPLHDTVKVLLLHNEIKLADKLRSEYKFPDRRYWWLRIQCLAEQGLWNELEKFSKYKKSPIGYEPFMDQCLKYKKELEAKKYLPRIKDELKVKYFVKLDMLLEAAQTALEHKDLAAITFVLARCNNRRLQEKIGAMVASLRNGK